MAMETVLTVRTEGLDPTAPPTAETSAPAAPLRPAATRDLAMMTAIHILEEEEAAPTRDGFAYTTKISRLFGPDTPTRTQTVLLREEDGMRT